MSEKTTAVAIKADLAAKNAPAVSNDELDLITRTVAQDATPDELKLYLYDCAREGVHPLDKLIHFTKRSGKYTPITSIDFMRMRAAETGEYAGSDDAVVGDTEGLPAHPVSMTVTVWRLVQGQRCAFTATARWDEYKPEQAFMWKKMPFTMLGKCAEALALRKGFPKQLAGLYAKEEMDQAQSEGPKEKSRPAASQAPARTLTEAVTQASHGGPPITKRELRELEQPVVKGPIANALARATMPKETHATLDAAYGPAGEPETVDVPEGYTQVLKYELDGYGWHHATLSRPAGVEVKTKFENKGDDLRYAFEHKVPARITYDRRSYVTKVELLKGVGGEEPDFDESNVPF